MYIISISLQQGFQPLVSGVPSLTLVPILIFRNNSNEFDTLFDIIYKIIN